MIHSLSRCISGSWVRLKSRDENMINYRNKWSRSHTSISRTSEGLKSIMEWSDRTRTCLSVRCASIDTRGSVYLNFLIEQIYSINFEISVSYWLIHRIMDTWSRTWSEINQIRFSSNFQIILDVLFFWMNINDSLLDKKCHSQRIAMHWNSRSSWQIKVTCRDRISIYPDEHSRFIIVVSNWWIYDQSSAHDIGQEILHPLFLTRNQIIIVSKCVDSKISIFQYRKST